MSIRRFKGKPHSKRSGPTGENQRKPNPTDSNIPRGSLCCLSSKKLHRSQKALPVSKKITPLIPTFSLIGNSSSKLKTACLFPPTGNESTGASGLLVRGTRKVGLIV